MIKIPATSARLPAIEPAISEGINVNITLLFGQKRYEQVAEAYIRGLEALRANGGDLGMSPVSRDCLSAAPTPLVDSTIEKKVVNTELRVPGGEELKPH
jgi:transaldolase / glucose-6-phosphate isomerase